MSAEAIAAQPVSKKFWGGGVSPFGVSWGKMYMWFFLVSDAFTFSSLLVAYGTLRHRYTDVWPKASDVFTHFPFYDGHIQLAYVGLMTFILIMSSVTMVLAVDAGHKRDNRGVAIWLGLTIIGGFMFLGSQAWEWYHFIKGTDHGAYVLTDGTIAHAIVEHDAAGHDAGHAVAHHDPPNTLRLANYKTVEGAEAEKALVGARHIQGANLTENEYGHPLFADFFFFITGFHGFHVFSGVLINIIIWFNVLNGIYRRRGHYEQVEKVGLYWHFVDLVWVFVFTFFYLV